MIGQTKARASIDSESIAELVVEAVEEIGSRRRIRLRYILTEDLHIYTRLLLDVETQGKRLLATVATPVPRLAGGLDQ